MSPSDYGSALEIFEIAELGCLLFAVGFMVYSYSSRQISIHIQILTFFAWILTFGFLFLIPLDIYFTLENEKKKDQCEKPAAKAADCEGFENGSTQEYKIMVEIWRAVYWISFLFTWVLLPFFQDYEAAGEFAIIGKIKRSIKVNLISIAVTLAIGFAFVCYLLFTDRITLAFLDSIFIYLSADKTSDNMEGFFIGLSNFFGIFLVVILLGHGLVMIPKKFYFERYEQTILKRCCFQAVSIMESKMKTTFSVEERARLCQVGKKHFRDFASEFSQIMECIPEDILKNSESNPGLNEQHIKDLTKGGSLTIQKLIDLNKDTKVMASHLQRSRSRWDILLDSAYLSEDILNSVGKSYFDSEFYISKESSCIRSITDKLFWVWHCKLKDLGKLLCSLVFFLLSLVVLLGEISVFTNTTIFNPFGYILTEQFSNACTTQIFVFIPLLYITCCVFYGMFQIKLAGLYGLYRLHQTDAPSLMFFSINFARVSAPISYNYLKILSVKNSAFVSIVGAMDDVPLLGSANTYFFPILLVILIVFNALDLYSKILNSLGLKKFEFADSFDDRRIDQGKELIAKARALWLKKFTEIQNYPSLAGSPDKFLGYNRISSLREIELKELDEKYQKVPGCSNEEKQSTGSIISTYSSRDSQSKTTKPLLLNQKKTINFKSYDHDEFD